MKEPPYDVMKDIVVRAGIRDRMIADMVQSLQDIADWPTTATVCDLDPGVSGVQDHAALALKRYREAWSKL